MGLIIDCYLTIATRRKRGRSAVYGPCGCIQGSGTAVELTPGDGLSAKLKSSIRALKLTCTIKRSENSNQREVWCKIKKILAGWTWHSWRLGCTTIAGQLLLIKKTAMREGEKERRREREKERKREREKILLTRAEVVICAIIRHWGHQQVIWGKAP